MRAVIQRVTEGSVTVDGQITGEIKHGLVVFLGVEKGDTEDDVRYMADKVAGLRIFEDEEEKMNLSVCDIGGEVLSVSQFTLLGDVRKGKRPGFSSAALPAEAIILYQSFNDAVEAHDINVAKGIFQADMLVKIHNDGPVTILLDSNKQF